MPGRGETHTNINNSKTIFVDEFEFFRLLTFIVNGNPHTHKQLEQELFEQNRTSVESEKKVKLVQRTSSRTVYVCVDSPCLSTLADADAALEAAPGQIPRGLNSI